MPKCRPTADILALHDAIDNIESELKRELRCEAVIHMDPVVTDDPEVAALKEKVTAAVRDMDPALSIHDFRVVAGPTHTNVIFDLLIPYRFHLKDGRGGAPAQGVCGKSGRTHIFCGDSGGTTPMWVMRPRE